MGLVAPLSPTRPARVLLIGDLAVALEIVTAWPDAVVRVLAPREIAPSLRSLCDGDPRLVVVDAATGRDAEPLLPGDADVVVLAHALAPLSVSGRRALACHAGHAVVAGGCVVSCEPVIRGSGPLTPTDPLPTEVAADRPGPPLTAVEQDLLLRAAGLAASAAWEPSAGNRAVLGVHPDAGIEPALHYVAAES